MARKGSHFATGARSLQVLVASVTTVLAVASFAPAAHAATSVTNVTVSNASPSTAAGAQTSYAIGFKTSASGALVGSSGAHVTITFPSGTGVGSIHSSPLDVGATQEGFCVENTTSPPSVICDVDTNATVAANTTVAITVNGVVNPATVGAHTLSISTSADTATRTSPSYSVTAAGAVSKPSITIATPSPAVNAQTTYAIGITTSSSGALAGDVGSAITVALPKGTGLGNLAGSPLMHGATQIGFCEEDTPSPPVAICFVNTGTTVAASTALTMSLNGVVNPGSVGTNQASVATTSDTKSVKSASYSVSAGGSISALTVHDTPPSTSAGALTTYAIGFKTSAKGGLAGVAGSRITIALATGTVLTELHTSPVSDGGNQVGFCTQGTATPPVAICPINNGSTVAAGDSLSILLNGVTNPKAAGTKTLKVSTSSDTPTVTSPTYKVTAQSVVSGASIALASSATGATTNSTVKLTATTGLAGDSGSAITIGLGAGTDLTALTNSPLMDAGTQVGFCQKSPTLATTVVCLIGAGSVVHPGDHLVASIMTVKNPGASKQYSMKLSTTSDTKVKSVPYCVAAAGVPCITKFSPASGIVGDAVTIAGINLGSATAVKFNGTAAVIGTNTATKITTTVPTGATTGTISVKNAGGTATSSKQFTVM